MVLESLRRDGELTTLARLRAVVVSLKVEIEVVEVAVLLQHKKTLP